MRRGLIGLVILLLCSATLAGEAQPGFTTKPTVSRVGAKVRIKFSVDRLTDVAVYIEDAKGKIMRHLVAGMLGSNPPAPLRANSLEQVIWWDGKADYGKPAEGGPFRARVALGMKPVFDAKMFDEPQRLLGLNGLATRPNGELYTKGGGRDGGMGPAVDYRIYSRDGRYIRTIAPFPAGLDRERVSGFGVLRVGEEQYIPRVHEMRSYNFYPVDLRGPRLTQMAVNQEGYLFFMSGGRDDPRICVLDSHGGVPEGWSFAGKGINTHDPKKRKSKDNPNLAPSGFLACSADGKRIYLSGVGVVYGKTVIPAVFWTDARERGPVRLLAGDLVVEGSGEGEFKDPQGVAVDGRGHVLVADRGNGRVCVLSGKDGAFVSSFPVPNADKVQVDGTTGAVYVLTFAKEGSELVKFSNWKEHKEVCRLSLGGGGAERAPFLAVSGSQKPIIWVGSNGYRHYTLLRIPDLGEKFGSPKEMSPKGGYLVEDVFVDRLRDEVYVHLGSYYWRFKDGSDRAERVPINVAGNSGLQLQVCPRGNIYGYAWGAKLHRWDHDGKPLPFEKTGKNVLEIPSQMTYQLRGLFIDQIREEINIIQPNARRKIPNNRLNPACFGSVVRVYDLEGNLKREPVRSINFSACVGPRVDPAGNIYVGEPARPNSHELPAFFKGKLPPIKKEKKDVFYVPNEVFPYSWAYGSVVKFSSAGGSILWGDVAKHKEYKPWEEDVPEATNPVFYSQSSSTRIRKAPSQGVLWAYPGFFPLTSRVGCNCLASYFDVDYSGRVFYPDAGRSGVGVLDTNGNVICHFGGYGNRDAQGKDDYIPLAMGLAVAATDRYIYIGDIVNQCLVRVKLTYAAEEVCEIE